MLIQLHPGSFQVHAAGIGRAPGRDEQLLGAQLALVSAQDEFAIVVGHLAGLRVLQHLDALHAQGRRQRFADGRIVAVEQRVARQNRHLATQAGKGLRQLLRHH